MSEEKVLVWLPKKMAEKVKDLDSDELKFDLVSKYVDESKLDMKYAVEGIDEDVIVFKASLIKARAEFKKVVYEQTSGMDKLWQVHNLKASEINRKVSTLLKELKPITEELNAINALFGKIGTYNIERVIESLQKISNLYGKEKEMVQFVINHFGEDNND